MVIKQVIKGNWNEENKLKIIEYLESRGVVFTTIEDDMLEGARGKKLGHMFSYNPEQFRTKFCCVEYSETEIVCELIISNGLQYMTDYHKDFFELEISSLENYINNKEELVNKWQLLNEKANKSKNKVRAATIVLSTCVGIGFALSYNGLKDIF